MTERSKEIERVRKKLEERSSRDLEKNSPTGEHDWLGNIVGKMDFPRSQTIGRVMIEIESGNLDLSEYDIYAEKHGYLAIDTDGLREVLSTYLRKIGFLTKTERRKNLEGLIAVGTIIRDMDYPSARTGYVVNNLLKDPSGLKIKKDGQTHKMEDIPKTRKAIKDILEAVGEKTMTEKRETREKREQELLEQRASQINAPVFPIEPIPLTQEPVREPATGDHINFKKYLNRIVGSTGSFGVFTYLIEQFEAGKVQELKEALFIDDEGAYVIRTSKEDEAEEFLLKFLDDKNKIGPKMRRRHVDKGKLPDKEIPIAKREPYRPREPEAAESHTTIRLSPQAPQAEKDKKWSGGVARPPKKDLTGYLSMSELIKERIIHIEFAMSNEAYLGQGETSEGIPVYSPEGVDALDARWKGQEGEEYRQKKRGWETYFTDVLRIKIPEDDRKKLGLENKK